MKKIVSLILSLAMVVTFIPSGLFTIKASAATSGTTGDCTWTLNGSTLTISGNGDMANYDSSSTAPWGTSITKVIVEDGVTSIGWYAFSNCSELTNITIPNSVTSIGQYAFYKCTNITSIIIPDSVTSIGAYVFSGCTNLTSATLPSNITSMDSGIFYNCKSLANFTIPSEVTSIGWYTFYNCKSLTSIAIPNGVTSIGKCAFSGCSGFTSITIPNGVTCIDNATFSNCANLNSITIPSSVTSIGDNAFYNCTGPISVFYRGTESEKNNISIGVNNTALTDATWYYGSCIGKGEHTYDNDSDAECSVCNNVRYYTYTVTDGEITITDVDSSISGDIVIPSTLGGYPVTSIGLSAFSGCKKITSITIPNSVTLIAGCAFYNCTSLADIIIPNSVVTIHGFAFYNTAYYNNPDNWENDVLYIGNILISAKTSITGSYTVKNGTRLIATYAFENCENLTSIIIPNSVTNIGVAFSYCTSLESITLPFVGSSRTANETYDAVFGYLFGPYESYSNGTTEQEYAGGLKYYYRIPSSLKSVTITDATQIPYGAFSNCTNITSIIISDSVTSIGNNAFSNCTGLTSVYYRGTENERNSISIGVNNTALIDATWYYESCIGNTEHTYDASNNTICSTCGYSRIASFLTYTVIDGEATITNVDTSISGNVTIPSTLGGYPVTSIGYQAFKNCTGLTGVTIGKGVESIGYLAFQNCSNLTRITIPNSITSIGYSAFQDTAYYENSANWENSALYIGNCLIALKSFYSSSTYTIKNGTKTIADDAFNGCSNLISITIPDSVTNIGELAFSSCDKLTHINVDSNNQSYTSIDGVLFNKDKTKIVRYPEGKTATSYIIPSSVTSIDNYAFSRCSGLTSVTIPNGVTNISDGTFYYCESLESIILPNGVTSIGYQAFYECDSLKSIGIPKSVTYIGNLAFRGCINLETIWFTGTEQDKNNITILSDGDALASAKWYYNACLIGAEHSYDNTCDTVCNICGYVRNITHTYDNDCDTTCNICSETRIITHTYDNANDAECNICGNVRYYTYTVTDDQAKITDVDESISGNVIIPSTLGGYPVTSIGGSAFKGCTGLTSITIPDGVTSISSDAFYGCTALTSITVPNSVTSIGGGAFDGCRSLESITLPFVGSSRTANETYNAVFGYIFGYTSSSSIGGTQQYYASGSSYYYFIPSSLKSVTITDATQIPYGAFYNCTNLTSINIPNNVTSIGGSAFYNCTNLTSINIPNNVTSIGISAFENCTGLTSITVPNSVTWIHVGAFKGCTNLESITLPFVGFSRTANDSSDAVLGYIFGYTTVSSTIGTTRQYGSYYYYIPSSLKSVTITDATQIPYGAFYNCTNLASISLPTNVTTINARAFENCTGLTSITIPNGVTGIVFRTFSGCTGLTDIDIPNSVTEIGPNAFYNCTSLKNITIPNSVTEIGDEAFSGCKTLESITIPNGVTSINSYAFSGCKTLESITIPNGVTNIGARAFYNCASLANITIPSSVASISEGAFIGCNAIETVNYGGTPTKWASLTNKPSYSNVVYYNRTGIEVTTLPTKTQYIENSEELNLSGGAISVYYKDGSFETLNLIEANVTGFDNTKLGKQTLTVSYAGFTDTFEVEVIAKSLSSIAVTTKPTKLTYIESTLLDDTGMVLTLYYDNGTSKVITTGWVSEYDFSTVGTAKVKVTYGGKECTYDVTVVAKTLTHITIESTPSQLEYLEGDTVLDTDGLAIRAYYNNNTDEIIVGNYAVTGYDSTPGTKTITVTYGGKTATFTVNVIAKSLSSIKVTTKPTKLSYLEGESFDKTGMVVTAYYDNNTSSIVTDYTISGYSSTVGTKTITVTYAEKTATFTVTVNSRVPASISSNKYTIRGNVISKITTGTKVSTFLSSLNEGEYCKVYNGDKAVSKDSAVGTGMVVKIMDGNTVKASYTVIVTGDTNGDGNITVTDMIAIKSHILGKTMLKNEYFKAADTSGDNGISVTDFIQIKAQILGKGTITAR